jgi:heme oxygenase
MTVTDFAAHVREATLTEHREAEESPFIRGLMGGTGSLEEYAALATQLWLLYGELERLAPLAAAADVRVAPFVDPRLARADRIAADLDHLVGPGWAERAVPRTATSAYLVRLREVVAQWPCGFVAHHYTRYLGDLSGGQVIKTMLKRHYAADDAAVSFYDFAEVGDLVAFKRHYRVLLDSLELGDDERERFTREVAHAYRLNRFLFDELGAAVSSR